MEPTIYLFFNGTCLEAMTHYAEVLGGTIGYVFRNGDAPDDGSRMPGGADMIMNMSVTLGGATVMASDNCEDMYSVPQGFRVSISPSSREDFGHVYDALARDARSVEMPPDETFWAERFAMFTDRYGTPWMLNYTGNKAPA
ncbi:VOC family protein [Labrenzia sp. 011]|uniref:VOC family protein n=1 Tax=Labrenzia sp. 011 TaxID=2171494 RepID=UPI000D51FBE6|nr:VOC family protein [Labrenzia sp. 011]PVB60067.1 VOC family protein [Labrenzia sp. 011]